MFQRLDKLMPQSVRRAGAERTVKAAMILDAVSSVLTDTFGEDVSRSMRPVRFKDGVVTVRCGESALTDEIRMMEEDIIKAADGRLGEGIVRGIRPIG